MWNRIPPSIEWHLSVKCHARQAFVTWEFAARSARYSDSHLGTGPELAPDSAHTGRATPCHAGLLRVMNALGQGSPRQQIDLVASGNLSGLLRSQADTLVDLATRP
jgi:hypothetical protein